MFSVCRLLAILLALGCSIGHSTLVNAASVSQNPDPEVLSNVKTELENLSQTAANKPSSYLASGKLPRRVRARAPWHNDDDQKLRNVDVNNAQIAEYGASVDDAIALLGRASSISPEAKESGLESVATLLADHDCGSETSDENSEASADTWPDNNPKSQTSIARLSRNHQRLVYKRVLQTVALQFLVTLLTALLMMRYYEGTEFQDGVSHLFARQRSHAHPPYKVSTTHPIVDYLQRREPRTFVQLPEPQMSDDELDFTLKMLDYGRSVYPRRDD